jgi:hypothetical protein
MLQFDIDVDGVVAALKVAGENLGQYVPMALELGGDLVAAEAKRNHGYTDRTGLLTNSIARDQVQGSFDGQNLSVTVSAGAPYAAYVELGTRPHKIRPRYRKALRWPVEGGFAFARSVNHPGTDPQLFLFRATEVKFAEVQEALRDATALSFANAGFEVA